MSTGEGREQTVKIGAAIWPFQWDAPYEEPIRRIASLGFTAIELIIWNEDSFDYYTPRKVRELRSLLDAEGLELSQVVHTPPHLASPDAADREVSLASFRRAVDVAAELGTPIINSLGAFPFGITVPNITERPYRQRFSLGYPRHLDWTGNWSTYVESVARATADATSAGLRYSIEAHPFRWIADSASMMRLIEQVGSPDLGMNFDPSHLFPVGDLPHAVIYKLGDRIFHCAFSDNDGTSNLHWRPGKGKIDWQAVLDALWDTGYHGVISMELEDAPGVSYSSKRNAPGGPGTPGPNPVATEGFGDESSEGAEYIASLARKTGFAVQWGGRP
jgi:sugar phosphate isomerase/epimerase